MLPLKTLMIGSIGIAITLPLLPARKNCWPPAPEGDNRSDGIRIAQASNGFQLVEHGLWQSALNSTPSDPEIGAVGGSAFLSLPTSKTGAGPSG